MVNFLNAFSSFLIDFCFEKFEKTRNFFSGWFQPESNEEKWKKKIKEKLRNYKEFERVDSYRLSSPLRRRINFGFYSTEEEEIDDINNHIAEEINAQYPDSVAASTSWSCALL